MAWAITLFLLAGVVWLAIGGDVGGTVLTGISVLSVGALALHGTLLRPRLAAGPDGILARTAGGAYQYSWAEARLRLRTTRRFGRDSLTLEVESGEHLLVFGRIDLGEDPRDVMDVLTALKGQALS
ncbi:PH domain-containing protein [Amycolatopsis sp. cmx-11-51]|uniref:PH domain-containing protein n=1 Tax=unclassified Amycolatopsis TaxID=2618356 RepID=UPI0039E38281